MWPAEGFYIRAKKWVDELQRQGNPHLVMAFVGNKVDLEAKRKVGTQEALEYARRPLLPGDVDEDGAEHRRALLRAREICMSSATLDVTPRPAVTLSHRSERRSQEGSSRKEWEG